MTTEREKLIEEAEAVIADSTQPLTAAGSRAFEILPRLLAALRTPPRIVDQKKLAGSIQAFMRDRWEDGENIVIVHDEGRLPADLAAHLLASGIFLSAGEHAAQVLDEAAVDYPAQFVTVFTGGVDLAERFREWLRARAREHREGQ